MLSPDYLDKLGVGAMEIAGELYGELIKAVVKRLLVRLKSEDEIIFSSADRYAIKTIQDAGILLGDITKVIAKYTRRQEDEIRKAYQRAGIEAIHKDDEMYRLADISPTALAQSPHLIRLLQRNYEVTMGQWDNYTRTTAGVLQQTFINECNRAYLQVSTGAIGYNRSIMDAIGRLISQDINTVVYRRPDGTISKTDNIEVATLRAVRTGVNQACAYITSQVAHDHGIYQFLTSAHYGARPSHAVWQGKVFWVDWDELERRTGLNFGGTITVPDEIKGKYDEFCVSTEIGTVTGLCGANCRHSYSPYIEGLDYSPFPPIDEKQNAKDYKISQKQRAMERAIRKSKRKVEMLEEAIKNAPNEAVADDLDKAQNRAIGTLQKQNARYRAFCEAYDLKPQEFRLFVG